MHVIQGRRPSGGQKTVRELLHQNGGELKDPSIPISEKDIKGFTESELRGHANEKVNQMKLELSDTKLAKSLPGISSANSTQPLLPSFNPARPMFYPQLVPMAGAMPSMGLPFMIPQFGVQSLVSQVQPVPAVGNPIYLKDEKPIHALDKIVTSHKESLGNHNKSAISHSQHPHKSQRVISPPSAHSSSTKYPSTHASPLLHQSDLSQRPITPAHSNNVKREYPYPETSRNQYVYTLNDIKTEPGMHKDLKRQKTSGSHSMFLPKTSDLDAPVLDLSMKTLKAEEARHQRGESLLFDASFNKDSKFGVKSEHIDVPQDLSVKSKPSVGGGVSSGMKGIPLNVPLPMQSMAGMGPVKKETSKQEVGKNHINFPLSF